MVAAFRTEYGLDELVRVWRDARTSFWDPRRPPAL
jgi:hypothetical protein